MFDSKDIGIKSFKIGYKSPFGVNGYHGMWHGDWLNLYYKYNNIFKPLTNVYLLGRVIKRIYYWIRNFLVISILLRTKKGKYLGVDKFFKPNALDIIDKALSKEHNV